MTRLLRFVFDYISPYAYLASTQIRALGRRHDVTVEPVPVLFAAMLASTGSRGPAEIPVRREYMINDVTRLSRALGVPIVPPATHPFNPLLALRVTHAAATEDRWTLVDAIYRAAWVDSRRIDDPAVIAAIAGDSVLSRAATDDVKSALRNATDAMITESAFGVPTMFVDDQLFWGVDSLPLLDRYLAGEQPDALELTRWRAIVPSALRRSH